MSFCPIIGAKPLIFCKCFPIRVALVEISESFLHESMIASISSMSFFTSFCATLRKLSDNYVTIKNILYLIFILTLSNELQCACSVFKEDSIVFHIIFLRFNSFFTIEIFLSSLHEIIAKACDVAQNKSSKVEDTFDI